MVGWLVVCLVGWLVSWLVVCLVVLVVVALAVVVVEIKDVYQLYIVYEYVQSITIDHHCFGGP